MVDVLIAEDDGIQAAILEQVLLQEEHSVRTAEDGTEAAGMILEKAPDLLLLDLNLPGHSGWEILDLVRGKSEIRVIVITGDDDQNSMIRALDGGADDYITKPVDGAVLLARVRAVLRRTSPSETMECGRIQIDNRTKTVSIDGAGVHLSPREYELLSLLASDPGRVFGDREILHRVWGDGTMSSPDDVKRYIYLLRKRVEPDPASPTYVITVPGFGYRLDG
jgi:DNA-binding response OmpR family regulator